MTDENFDISNRLKGLHIESLMLIAERRTCYWQGQHDRVAEIDKGLDAIQSELDEIKKEMGLQEATE